MTQDLGQSISLYDTREGVVGAGLVIRRALPLRERRTIGPWCFLDHFGPATIPDPREGMWVGPHPHIGLQTVTWLTDGEVLHRDSLGSEQIIRPGQLNIMTSGSGISHTEETPPEHSSLLHGVQLWVALPEADSAREPGFEHHADLPRWRSGDVHITLITGQAAGERSPARVYSPMVGMELLVGRAGAHRVALDPRFEHGVIAMEGEAVVAGQALPIGKLMYLPPGHDQLPIETSSTARLILIGGEPFREQIMLWWNFVGRSAEEIMKAREQWLKADPRFGAVHGFDGDPLPPPEWVPLVAPR